MNHFFLNPWALALGLLSGGIVLLYILKLRRKKVQISSTLLWESVISDTRANAPWQKLRKNLLMLIQILALLLLALALARPFVFGSARAGGKLVIILDTSSSMLAKDVAPDRLGQAIKVARQAISDLGPAQEVMLVAAGPSPTLLASFSREKRQLLGALEDVRAYAGGVADLDAALKLASSVTAGSKTRALVVSDGALPDLDPLAVRDLRLSFASVGNSAENIAITGAGSRLNPLTGQYDLFASLRSTLAEPTEVDVVISLEDEPVDVQTVELQPGEQFELSLSDVRRTEAAYAIHLDIEDALEADNSAYVTLPPSQELNVGLCTTGESILMRKALQGVSGVSVFDFVDGALQVPASASRNVRIDCWIVDGDADVPVDLAASYLFFHTSSHAALPVLAGAEAKLDFSADPPVIPMVIGVDKAHPLLRYVNMADVKFKAVRRCELRPWARSVVDGSEGPLVVEGDNNGQRTVYLAFDPYQSDFPLRAAFPIFLANALRYLGNSGVPASGRTLEAGRPVDLTAPPLASKLRVSGPDKYDEEINLPSRKFTLRNLRVPGEYKLDYFAEDGKPVGTARIGVSLASETESNITPAGTLRVTGSEEALANAGASGAEEVLAQKSVRVNREFYVWLIGIVLVLMAAEWFLFHTRVW